MPDLMALRPGDPAAVGDYSLSGRIGEGGQGTVYLATDKNGAKVAVKLLRADLAGDREASERFVREVAVARRVAPFCTAQVVETGLFGNRPYIVSEYIEGPTLTEVVQQQGPRSGASLHRLAIGTITALVAIHQAGIVHRDFKPSNVLLASDGPRVIDFGIARALDLTSSLTAAAIGTPSFMAPEQLTESSPGPESDMFAWACTLLYAASGQAPFGTDSLAAVFNRIMNAEPDVGSVTDPALRSLVADCLAKDPMRRPSAGDALLRLLGHAGAPAPQSVPNAAPPSLLAQGTAVAAPPPYQPQYQPQPQPYPYYQHQQQQQPPPLPPTRPVQKGSRVGWIVAAAAVAVVVLLVGGVFAAVKLSTLNLATTSPTPTPPPTTTRAPTPTPSADVPVATRTVTLPGTSVVIEESDDDPVKLTSYSLEYGKSVYIRQQDSTRFTTSKAYFEYTLNRAGTFALGTDVDYTSDYYAQVSIINHRTGEKTSVKLTAAPIYPTTPRWSPDGEHGLVTLYRARNNKSEPYGYAIIDVASHTGQAFEVKDKGAGEWRFFWNGDSRSVGTWVGGKMRFYDLKGSLLRTLSSGGSPVWVESDDVSPSGERFLTHCAAAGNSVCAKSTTGESGQEVSIPFISTRLIGWWDDEHIAGWRTKGAGYEAVVVDMNGEVKRVLATAPKAADFDKMGVRYTRTSP
ncbi:protein kinase [Nonomuraea sp. NPDC050556]|uniref:protein kinase domain-containing protein n=1 Tax=Nonomuraea sp. NPDC050556 TaxID=3364369 RepID=UPI00378D35F9